MIIKVIIIISIFMYIVMYLFFIVFNNFSILNILVKSIFHLKYYEIIEIMIKIFLKYLIVNLLFHL